MSSVTRVLLVGEDEDTCSLAAVVLMQAAVFDVVGPVGSWVEMANLLLAHSPQVVLLDLDSPGRGVPAALKMARLLSPPSRFIGLAGDPKVDGALLVDLDALLLKDAPLDQTLAALGRASSNGWEPVQEVQSQVEDASGAIAPDDQTPAAPADPQVDETVAWTPEPDTLPGEHITTHGTINLVVGPFGSFRSLATFQEALGRLEGVRSVKVRRFYRGTLHASVQYDGILPLAERLPALAQFKPRVIADRAGTMQLAIEMEEAFAPELAARDSTR